MSFAAVWQNALNSLPLHCGYGVAGKPSADQICLVRVPNRTQVVYCPNVFFRWNSFLRQKPRKWRLNAFGSLPPSGNCKLGGKDDSRVRMEEVSVIGMKDRLLKRLNSTLAERQLLKPQEKILVAVSGGQDSMSLIWLLHSLTSNWGWELGIAHCDHQWNSGSRSQASHVSQIAADLKIDYYQAVATKPVSGESAARTWRYGILQRIAISHGYSAILTAHTSSDRVETLLHNMFRGSGIHGLQSLTWKRQLFSSLSLSYRSAFTPRKEINYIEHPHDGRVTVEKHMVALIRPLLDTTRAELGVLCEQLQLPVWLDPSNESLEFSRNRIRNELLPYLRRHFQPEIEKSLARLADIIQEEEAYMSDLCRTILTEAESGSDEKLEVNVILSLPLALQRRVLKLFVESFTGRSLGFDHIEKIRLACYKVSSKTSSKKQLKMDVPGNSYLTFAGRHVLLSRRLCSEEFPD
ncbi:hypothetical protein O6H91_08G027900 [Diphasiastrum complanatum]|uniref:Uncharacterized protein n=1 Tax=Diphasiastrum complanatum TaxID=34168 RepID=A0ACC2CWW0_DIPCM|nr:hypothetical protein O6H91_08G027900 [Diphasiastrum complanatum]